MLLGMLMLPTVGKTETNSCNDVLSLCRQAVNDQIILNHKQQIEIKANEDLVKTQREKIDYLEKENNSILKNPTLWLGLGLVLGVVITK